MKTLLGAYIGNDPNAVVAFEFLLERRIDFVTVFVGGASWRDFDAGPTYELDLFAHLNRPRSWSIPLIPAGADLAHAARGAYDAHYIQAASTIARRQDEPLIYVRTGWEQNGNWMKWAAKGKEAEYIAAFQVFATCFRSVSPRFRLVWCPNIGQDDPEPSYPGDRYVDVVGIDVYHNPRWDPPEPNAAWSYMVTRRFGLQWHLEFARAHAKPMAYPEWGVSSDGFGPYIMRMAQWFCTSNVAYHSYWESNTDYPGLLGSARYPSTAAAFRRAFR